MAESKQRIKRFGGGGRKLVFGIFNGMFSLVVLFAFCRPLYCIFHFQILCLFNKKAKICINHTHTHRGALKAKISTNPARKGSISSYLATFVGRQRGVYLGKNAIVYGSQPLRLKHDHQLISPAAPWNGSWLEALPTHHGLQAANR